MRRSVVPVLALLAATLLAGCGDDGSDEQDPKDDPTSSATSTETSDATDDPTDSSDAIESGSDATTEAAGNTKKVEETAGKLDCTAAAGTEGFEGETEHVCGPFLIVDWSTAGISEEEMFTAIDNWVDEERPVWLYAGDLVLVYGTQADLDAISSEFE